MPSVLEIVNEASIHHRTAEARRILKSVQEFSKSQSRALLGDLGNSYDTSSLTVGGTQHDSPFLREARLVARKAFDSSNSQRPTDSKTLRVATPWTCPLQKFLNTRKYQLFFGQAILHDSNGHNEPAHPMRFLSPQLVTEIYNSSISFMSDTALAASYNVTHEAVPSKASFYNMTTEESAKWVEIYLYPRNMSDWELMWKSSMATIMAEHGFTLDDPALRPDQEATALDMFQDVLTHIALFLDRFPQHILVTDQSGWQLSSASDLASQVYEQHPTFPGVKANPMIGLVGITAILQLMPMMNKPLYIFENAKGESQIFTFGMQLQQVLYTADRRRYHQQGPMQMARRPGGVYAVDIGILQSHVGDLRNKLASNSGRSLMPFVSGAGHTSRSSLLQNQSLGVSKRDNNSIKSNIDEVADSKDPL